MDGSHHVNVDSIIYRKRAIHRTALERPFLHAKGFNTNLVQFLMQYHVITSKVHVYSSTCIIFHVHGSAHKTVLCVRKILIYEGLNLIFLLSPLKVTFSDS